MEKKQNSVMGAKQFVETDIVFLFISNKSFYTYYTIFLYFALGSGQTL